MTTRDRDLTAMRPNIPSIALDKISSEEEHFQNETLRPVAKLQNELLIEVFKNYIKKHKNVFYQLNLEKRMEYLTNAIQKDVKFRNSLKGIIIGHFTMEEYRNYITNSSALNKRMMNIVRERLTSQIQLFENNLENS